jgi:hypothetical protein
MSKTDKTDPPEADKEPESPVNPAGEDVADDDKVGYRRPPKSSQYKKGQSGNPLGSSRKARMRQRQQTLPFNDLIIENSHKLLRIREGNRTSIISTKEALLRKQSNMGLAGNRLALNSSIHLIQEAEQSKLAEVLENYNTYRDCQTLSREGQGLP